MIKPSRKELEDAELYICKSNDTDSEYVRAVQIEHGMIVEISKDILLNLFDFSILNQFELKIKKHSYKDEFVYVKFIEIGKEDKADRITMFSTAPKEIWNW